MIVKQTTTLIFEYPQDYVQEQEWCKTKEDRWIHKGTDTLGAVYENQISYSIGATADRKTEPIDKDINVPCKTEPQTDYKKWETPPKFEHKGIITTCVSVPLALIMDEPQTDIGTSDTVYSDTAGYVPRVDMTDCSWK